MRERNDWDLSEKREKDEREEKQKIQEEREDDQEVKRCDWWGKKVGKWGVWAGGWCEIVEKFFGREEKGRWNERGERREKDVEK